MKVLIVSNNVISNTNNMGKTLKAYFSAFGPEELAQFYIHAQRPTDRSICQNYYRFTDLDALKSIVSPGRRGKVFRAADIVEDDSAVGEDMGRARVLYDVGSRKTPLMHLGRNLVWRLGRWFTPELKVWLNEVSPDVIFFASGDSVFMYDIALRFAEYLQVPLITSCYDDYYVYDINENRAFAGLLHRALLRRARRVFARSVFATTVCETMAVAYSELFGTPCHVLYTGAKESGLPLNPEGRQISYLGNLSLDRYRQLMDMGRALQQLERREEPTGIDVYSGTQDGKIIAELTAAPGIRFHGAVSPEEVQRVMARSMAVIHTESFGEKYQNRVRFSVSTKIAESLMSGPCLLAYGARGIASFDYLAENRAAFVIDRPEQLEDGLLMLIEHPEQRAQILRRARALARKNHSLEGNAALLRRWIEEAVHEGQGIAP